MPTRSITRLILRNFNSDIFFAPNKKPAGLSQAGKKTPKSPSQKIRPSINAFVKTENSAVHSSESYLIEKGLIRQRPISPKYDGGWRPTISYITTDQRRASGWRSIRRTTLTIKPRRFIGGLRMRNPLG